MCLLDLSIYLTRKEKRKLLKLLQSRDSPIAIYPEAGRYHHRDIQNKEYVLRTLQQLRSENDIAFQLANPEAINSDIEEFHQEIARLQQQVHMAEEQIRMYEPEPMRFSCTEELESCEKHLLDTLSRVMQRKDYLLSNHLSSYDPSGMQPGIFENDTVGWLPDGGADHAHILSSGSQNQPQMFDASASLNTLRDFSSTIYDPLLQGSSSNAEASTSIGECHITNPNDVNFPTWPSPYNPTGIHSSSMPPSLYPQIQHRMVGPNISDMLPREQMEMPVSNMHVQVDNEGANYDNKVSQPNGQ